MKKGEIMKLGTIAYNEEIYNLDYMTAEEIKELLQTIECNKNQKMRRLKNRATQEKK